MRRSWSDHARAGVPRGFRRRHPDDSDAVVDPCSTPFTPAFEIQGSGPNAAFTGTVTTQGVVVGDFEGDTAASGLLPAGRDRRRRRRRRPTASSSSPARQYRERRPDRARHRVCARALQPDGAQRLEQQQRAVPSRTSSTAGRATVDADRRDPAVRSARTPPSATRACSCASRSRSSSPSTSTTSASANSSLRCPCRARRGRSHRRRSTSPAPRRRPARSPTACSRITLDDGLSGQNPSVLPAPERRSVLADEPLPRRRHGAERRRRAGVRLQPLPHPARPGRPTTRRSIRARRHRRRSAATYGSRRMNTLNFFLTLDYPTGDPLDNTCGPARNARVPRRRRRPAARAHATARQAARRDRGSRSRHRRAQRAREHARRRSARRPDERHRRRAQRDASEPGRTLRSTPA